MWLDAKVCRSELGDRVRATGSTLQTHKSLMKKQLLEAVRLLEACDTRARLWLPASDDNESDTVSTLTLLS